MFWPLVGEQCPFKGIVYTAFQMKNLCLVYMEMYRTSFWEIVLHFKHFLSQFVQRFLHSAQEQLLSLVLAYSCSVSKIFLVIQNECKVFSQLCSCHAQTHVYVHEFIFFKSGGGGRLYTYMLSVVFEKIKNNLDPKGTDPILI